MIKLKGILMLLALFYGNIAVADRCPAGDTGCTPSSAGTYIQDRVNEGARNVWEDNNSSGRIREVRDTLKDCVNCGIDAIKDGFGSIGGKAVR